MKTDKTNNWVNRIYKEKSEEKEGIKPEQSKLRQQSKEKQRKEKSLYYTQKFVNDGIFGSLHIDKRVENVL